MRIIHEESVGSTNDYIKNINEENVLVYADCQYKGRGQRGNGWESEPQKNLTFSMSVRPSFLPAEKQFELSMLVSLSIVLTLEKFGVKALIKWPNDIYIGDRKICGILIENEITSGGSINRSIIGVGINVNQVVFVSDAPNPTSLALETGREFCIEEVLRVFNGIFEEMYCGFRDGAFEVLPVYLEKLYRKEVMACYSDGNGCFNGIIRGIGDYGVLLVEKEDGTMGEYHFKEIEYII